MPDVTLETTSGYLAVPAGSQGPRPGARLDYKPELAEDSGRRILAFFGEHLRSGPVPSA